MKALITSFVCLCVVPALAAPLICIQGNGASHQALRDRCPGADASFVNSPQSDPDQAGTDTTVPDMTGPLFAPLNLQVLMNLGPLTDSQMKSLFGKDASENADPTTSAQLPASGSGASATLNSPNSPATTNAVSMPVGIGMGMDPLPPPGGSVAQGGTVAEAGSASPSVPVPNATTDPVAAAASTPAAATPETGSIAMIGSGLVFLSLVASSTRKRKLIAKRNQS